MICTAWLEGSGTGKLECDWELAENQTAIRE